MIKCSIKDKYGKRKERKQHSIFFFCLNRQFILKKYVTEVQVSVFAIHVALEAEV